MKAYRPMLAACALLSTGSSASADYVATSFAEGSFCRGFGIEMCEFKRIDATVKDGGLFGLPKSYDDVDEYRGGRCWVKIHDGWTNWLLGDKPVFLQYRSGPRHLRSSYETLETPDYVTFMCRRRP